MTSVATADPHVNTMSNERAIDVAARLKRDWAIRKAAQVLADADAVRHGAELRGLSQMPGTDRDWYLNTAKGVIGVYEVAAGIERPAEPSPVLGVKVSAQALETILRQQGRTAAMERGHEDMGTYQTLQDGRQVSVCRKCARAVLLNLSENPSISGSAIDEGCLSAAGKDAQ